MKLLSMYSEKLTSAEKAVQLIEPGDEIVVPLGVGEPDSLLRALFVNEKLNNNSLYQMLTMRKMEEIIPDQLKVVSMFLGGVDRSFYANGLIDLLPNHFSNVPRILKDRLTQPVIFARVSPLDGDGYFSLGTNCDYTAPLLKYAKTIIVEVNELMPRTFGKNRIHLSEVHAIIEDHQPLPEVGKITITNKDERIGKIITNFIQDGDTIQIGIGAIPNVVMGYLKHYKDLGFYSEMLPEMFVDLFESGAVTNRLKPIHQHISTATFAFGTERLYRFIHENPHIYMLPVNETNDVRQIAKFDQFVSINGTVEVDFLGQCNSEVVNGTYYSSTGGQGDFSKGATLCNDGRGIICLHSTTKDESISKIVPTLSNKSVVSTSKNDVDYIVTEYGYAHLKNKTVSERTKALIRIAHPKFHDSLTFEAKKMGYI